MLLFTPARRRALQSLSEHGNVRISRATSVESRTVAWQSADWLIEQGLAERRWGQFLYLTVPGEHFAQELFDEAGMVHA